MNPRFYALNVGRADAFILEIPDGGNSRIALIDGGDKEYLGQHTVLNCLKAHRISNIDLLILTHLHPDHLGGLLAVAAEIDISEAVLPYPEFTIAKFETLDPVAQQTMNVFQDYQNLIRLLQAQNTMLSLQNPFSTQCKWQFGSTRLRQLVPESERVLAGFPYIEELIKNPALSLKKQEELLINFDSHANFDSSIWLVEDILTAEEWLLLGGDAPLPVWERLLAFEKFSPHVFKVSHHGMSDSFNEWLVSKLAPRWLLITNNNQAYRAHLNEWSNLAIRTNSRIYVTGSDPDTKYLLSDLPNYPIRI